MILDMQMPVYNGQEVIKKVNTSIAKFNRQNKGKLLLIEPRYIIITAFVTPLLRAHLLKSKVEQVYEKPIQLEELK